MEHFQKRSVISCLTSEMLRTAGCETEALLKQRLPSTTKPTILKWVHRSWLLFQLFHAQEPIYCTTLN